MKSRPPITFDNSYVRLGEQFYSRQMPVPVHKPGLIRVNRALAEQLGINPDWLESETGIGFAAGNFIPEGAEPVATVYAGHQFGGWSPQLGDGRAILLGEVIANDGVRYDVQLKGSGRTPYSRGGDGRAPLGPVLREYIVSEAMAVLGVPTTRALAAVTSGEMVTREGRLPGAVLLRVAQSHIRIGTFEYFSSRQDSEALGVLADHVIHRHYPHTAKDENPLVAMLNNVVARQASLIAQWQLLGFIHGVMNTDNMLLSGETVDYGPCAFMDDFDADTVFSSIDHGGRYAYRNQPHIAHWNLARLVQSLLPLIDKDQDRAVSTGQAIIDGFPGLVQAAYQQGMYKKLGLAGDDPDDTVLIQDLLNLMQEHKTDFTLTFRHLADLAGPETATGSDISRIFELPGAFASWLEQWRLRLASDFGDANSRQAGMYAVNPVFIPRNHLVQEVIEAAEVRQDFDPFHKLMDVLSRPCMFEVSDARYAMPPRPEQVVRQTFCGT